MWHKLRGKRRCGVTDGRKLQALFVRMIDKALLRQECEVKKNPLSTRIPSKSVRKLQDSPSALHIFAKCAYATAKQLIKYRLWLLKGQMLTVKHCPYSNWTLEDMF